MAGSHDMGLYSYPKRAERGRRRLACSLVANSSPKPRGCEEQGFVPRIFHSVVGSRLWVKETWKCVFRRLQGLCTILYAFAQTC